MNKFSANLGFLWTAYALPDAIRAAKRAGFDAVECHWPYAVPASEVAEALDETELRMLGLNTIRGNVNAKENGLSALPGRKLEARDAIDQALAYAIAISTPNIHVMAGNAHGEDARKTFVENLHYATEKAALHGITILIEPLNHYDAPNYFLKTSEQAKALIEEVQADNLKLMFDCYHVQIMEGDITRRLINLKPIIGHIQIASVPSRAEPDSGELDYRYIMDVIHEMGYVNPVGAEYKPSNGADMSFDWMHSLRR